MLRLYHPARLNWANAQARRTSAPKVVMNHWASSRRRVGLRLFSEGLAQHVLVERQVGHQALQAPVLLLQLPHPAQLAHAQMRELLLPLIERRLADPQLPADIRRRRPALGLPERVGDLNRPGFLGDSVS